MAYGKGVHFLDKSHIDLTAYELFVAINSLNNSGNYDTKFIACADREIYHFFPNGDSGYYYYSFPETDVIKEIRKNFVMSDERFNELKKQKYFRVSAYHEIEDVVYENGNFIGMITSEGGYGGYGKIEENIVGYKYSNGVLKIAVDRLWGDYEEEPTHSSYYEIEYVYSGTDKIWVECNAIVSMNKQLIDSLRINSFNDITDISSYTLRPSTDTNIQIDFVNPHSDTHADLTKIPQQTPAEYYCTIGQINEQNRQVIDQKIDSTQFAEKIIGYSYNQGILKICYQYQAHSKDKTLYLELEYTYSGSDKMIIDDNCFSYSPIIISKNKAQLQSLSLKSAKFVTDTTSYVYKPLTANNRS